MAIEILKESDPKKVESWDRIHDKRKLYRCERCGAEWKCEYGENKFRSRRSACNGDPDILCQCCGFPTVKEVTLREIADDDVVRGHRLADNEAMGMRMREVDNALKLADVFPNPFSSEAYVGPSDETKCFCCGVDAYMMPCVYTSKGSLWFEDKPAGKLEVINDSVTEYNVIRLVFELETEFNWLCDHKLGEFNFKIEVNKEYDEIQLRLWRKE